MPKRVQVQKNPASPRRRRLDYDVWEDQKRIAKAREAVKDLLAQLQHNEDEEEHDGTP